MTMADYRQIHTSIWDDDWFCNLSSDEKVVFIWLFSNRRATVSGLYKFTEFICGRETGLPIPAITNAIKYFCDCGKIMVEDDWVWVKNLRKYNDSKSPNAYRAIMHDVNDLPDNNMKIQYLEYYGHEDDENNPLPTPGSPLPTPDNPLQAPDSTYEGATNHLLEQEQEKEHEKEHIYISNKPKKHISNRDERTTTPPIQAFRHVTGKYPAKALYDKVIMFIGDVPDIQKLKAAYTEWLSRGYNPNATTWLEWYRDGVPVMAVNKSSNQAQDIIFKKLGMTAAEVLNGG